MGTSMCVVFNIFAQRFDTSLAKVGGLLTFWPQGVNSFADLKSLVLSYNALTASVKTTRRSEMPPYNSLYYHAWAGQPAVAALTGGGFVIAGMMDLVPDGITSVSGSALSEGVDQSREGGQKEWDIT